MATAATAAAIESCNLYAQKPAESMFVSEALNSFSEPSPSFGLQFFFASEVKSLQVGKPLSVI